MKEKKSGTSSEERSAIKKYEEAKQAIKDFEEEERKDLYTKEEWDDYIKQTEKDLDDMSPKYKEMFKKYKDANENLSKYKDEAIDASGQGKMFKALSSLREEIMVKAQSVKYIKKIPNPKGQGYIYFYTQDQVKEYEKSGKLPEDKKKPETQDAAGDKKQVLKDALKKIATIFSDALSGRDAVQPTGSAVEQTGENISNKKRLDKKKDTKDNTNKNKPEEKPKK